MPSANKEEEHGVNLLENGLTTFLVAQLVEEAGLSVVHDVDDQTELHMATWDCVRGLLVRCNPDPTKTYRLRVVAEECIESSANDWRSIETAPKYNIHFLGYFSNGEQHVVAISEKGNCYREMDNEKWEMPVLWMPLPESPKFA